MKKLKELGVEVLSTNDAYVINGGFNYVTSIKTILKQDNSKGSIIGIVSTSPVIGYPVAL